VRVFTIETEIAMPIDWSRCPAVRTKPGYISGVAALVDDPRVPAETVIVNMDEGMSAEDVVETFGLKTRVTDVRAVYDYVKAQRVAHPD
jgi:uncharacterized protein (DUF433 family)